MRAQIESMHKTIEDLKNQSSAIVLEKAKQTFNRCNWTKGRQAHKQDKGCETSKIKNLRGRLKFVNGIVNSDDSVTLVTSDNFFIKFYNTDEHVS